MYKDKKITVVIVAAGKSSRMGFDKLLHCINGKQVILKTAQVFESCKYVDDIIIVAGDNIKDIKKVMGAVAFKKPLQIVVGGKTRAHSVLSGLNACNNTDIVAIHDGARPFVSIDIINNTIKAAYKYGAAAPVVSVKDTIKLIDQSLEFIVGTVARKTIRAVQTPQIFNYNMFLTAFSKIPQEEYGVLTDDCMVAELAGKDVKLVLGEEKNIKITTIEDIN